MRKFQSSAILVFCFVSTATCRALSDGNSNRGSSDGALKYLSSFGYITGISDNKLTSSLIDEKTVKDAISEFQDFAGLEVTGRLDNETLATMALPRCGVKDKVATRNDSRFKRYTLQGSKWRIKSLTYKIINYPKQLTRSDVDAELQRAFDIWTEHTDLTFIKSTGDVNIEVSFESGEHGDGDSFDGPGGTLAHAYFPRFGGDVHFDRSEQWSINSYRGTNFFQVAAHEIGHSLGLSHSDVRQALMAPFYRGYQPGFELDSDDVEGIQMIYGRKTSTRTTVSSRRDFDKTTPRTFVLEDDDDVEEESVLCRDPSFDDVFTSAEGDTYILKGRNYWVLNEDSVDMGSPKLISTKWIGLPSHIDAAFTYKNGKTYFFKGKNYWRYKGTVMDGVYPKEISEGFPGIPDDVDAAVVWSGNGKIYFFKGSKFWRFDPAQTPPVKGYYPKPISNWDGIPNNLNAAFQHTNGYTYFFKDGGYYRFNDRLFAVENVNPPFPRSTAKWWFGCKNAPFSTIESVNDPKSEEDCENNEKPSLIIDFLHYHPVRLRRSLRVEDIK